MKKRHLYTVLLSVLVVLLLVSPVFAESLISPLPDEKPAEHDGCTEDMCAEDLLNIPVSVEKDEGNETITLHPDMGKTLYMNLASLDEYHVDLARYRDLCKHSRKTTYGDVDTGEAGYFCFDCGSKIENSDVKLEAVSIRTSAQIRLNCEHEYEGWVFHSEDEHERKCTKCLHPQYGSHTLKSPTCETGAYCGVCGGRDDSWEAAWGHDMVCEFDWSLYPGEYHDYYCRREIPLMWDCGYVEKDNEPCNISPIWYVEPAVDGIHECFQECTECGYLTNFQYEKCNIANGSCGQCNRVNPY